ncbi:MAG: hypothetical protein Q4A62_04285 [Eikenella sp.]|nr:hypothetical protein [Eikenella sp.]
MRATTISVKQAADRKARLLIKEAKCLSIYFIPPQASTPQTLRVCRQKACEAVLRGKNREYRAEMGAGPDTRQHVRRRHGFFDRKDRRNAF